ncbi:MAG: sodium/solute symporter [Caldisericia bacterium]|nr:sodium/solute symporter [Caldisericia bacterium]
MSNIWIHILFLVLYFIGLIFIGVYTGKKAKSSEDYHLGGRSIGAFVSSLSFVAAYFSSVVIIGGGGFGYKYGLATIWIGVVNVLVGCFLAWVILGKKTRVMTAKLHAISLPDFFQKRYNLQFAKTFTSIVIVLFLIIYNVSILKGLGNTFEVILNIPYTTGLLISGAIVLVYVMFGGYLAVVWTGFIQAIIMISGLVYLFFVTISKVGGLTTGVAKLQTIQQSLVETPGVWGFTGLISFMLVVSLGVWGMPQMVARFYSIKDGKAIRIGALIATIGGTMAIIPYLLGALTRIIYPHIVDVDLALPTLVNGIMPVFGISLFFIGVIAAGMSTFSSILITSSTSLIKDLWTDSLHKKMTEKQEIVYSRFINVAIGIISIAIAWNPPGLVLELTGFSWAIIASTCLAPYVLGLYWTKAAKFGALASMTGGFAVSLYWMIFTPYPVHGFIPGVVVSFVLFFVFSWIRPFKKFG